MLNLKAHSSSWRVLRWPLQSLLNLPLMTLLPLKNSVSTFYTYPLDNCSRLQQIFKSEIGKSRLFEVDSRIGLNGTSTFWSFPCLHDEAKEILIVWLGDINFDKFTKTTFMNLVNFAEKSNCKQIVFVMDREHPQKSILSS